MRCEVYFAGMGTGFGAGFAAIHWSASILLLHEMAEWPVLSITRNCAPSCLTVYGPGHVAGPVVGAVFGALAIHFSASALVLKESDDRPQALSMTYHLFASS